MQSRNYHEKWTSSKKHEELRLELVLRLKCGNHQDTYEERIHHSFNLKFFSLWYVIFNFSNHMYICIIFQIQKTTAFSQKMWWNFVQLVFNSSFSTSQTSCLSRALLQLRDDNYINIWDWWLRVREQPHGLSGTVVASDDKEYI